MATNPNIIANSNWNSIAIKRSTFGLETMTSCINSHIRPNQTVIADVYFCNADVYFCNIEHRTIIISMEIVANMDILTKVAMEIITNESITTRRTEQFLDNFFLLDMIDQRQIV